MHGESSKIDNLIESSKMGYASLGESNEFLDKMHSLNNNPSAKVLKKISKYDTNDINMPVLNN